VTNIAHEFGKLVKGLPVDDRTRDAARSLYPPELPMLNAPTTATTCNGVNSDNESRRQRNIYTAFEKAKATHVCFFFVRLGSGT